MLAWTFPLQCWTVAPFFSKSVRPVGQWILNLNIEGARLTKENRTYIKLIVKGVVRYLGPKGQGSGIHLDRPRRGQGLVPRSGWTKLWSRRGP